MRTVENLIAELKKFPKDAECFAFDGPNGAGIYLSVGTEEGVIFCNEDGGDLDSIMVFAPVIKERG